MQLGRSGGWTLRLNQAEFRFAVTGKTSPNPWGSWTPPAFDVIGHSALGIRFPADYRQYEGRGHSLWYGDVQEVGRYHWFETAFMVAGFIPQRGSQDPFSLNPGEESAKAVGSGMAEYQVAWPFTPLIIGELGEFIDRWAGWFADAAQGNLHHPSTMPERPTQGSWRTR